MEEVSYRFVRVFALSSMCVRSVNLAKNPVLLTTIVMILRYLGRHNSSLMSEACFTKHLPDENEQNTSRAKPPCLLAPIEPELGRQSEQVAEL